MLSSFHQFLKEHNLNLCLHEWCAVEVRALELKQGVVSLDKTYIEFHTSGIESPGWVHVKLIDFVSLDGAVYRIQSSGWNFMVSYKYHIDHYWENPSLLSMQFGNTHTNWNVSEINDRGTFRILQS